ncbi:formyl-CoA transferase [Mycobacterium avium subsp. paratuberculosis]|nr:formyl-CoA transferase [Mycobacterium avium subsp. paratuberculosis]
MHLSERSDSRPTPLRDLRVVEISDRIAGSYCGKLLLDAGAQVRKIEPPQGDWLRRYSASGSPVAPGADAPFFSYLNAGKRSVTFGSGGDDNAARFRAELAGADVIVVTAGPSRAAALGIDPSRLLRQSPRAIVVTISDFGWTGPFAQRAATEFTLQAWAGSPGFRGDPAGPPIAIGGDLGEYMGGVFAAFGVLALRRRVERGGPGEHLDLSMLEALTAMQSSEWLHSQLLRVPPIRRTTEVPSIEPAKDGYVGITMVTGQQWLDFAAMVECPQLEEIEQLRFQIGRWQYRDLIRELIHPWLAERTVAEIVELGQLFRLPIAALGNGSTIRDLEYVRERHVFVENPAGFHQPRPPWLMSACAPAPVGDTPAVGEADRESPWRRDDSGSAPDPTLPPLPLAGVRIVDLTAFWAGPSATHLLAAFGADVVKIESIQRPDGIRYSGGMRTDVDDWWEYGWVFHAMNTNKRSVTLDLGSEQGRGLFTRLVADADVVIENFSPRVMDQFGLTADVLLDINPRLVFARMPAFGVEGTWRDRVGFAPTMEQIAGLAWITGLPEGPPVTPRGACDPLAGVHAAFAVLAALNFAERTGTGQLVELAMLEHGAQRHRDPGHRGRSLRRHAEPPGQPRARRGDPEHLSLRRSRTGQRRLDRGQRRRRRAVAGAGGRDGSARVVCGSGSGHRGRAPATRRRHRRPAGAVVRPAGPRLDGGAAGRRRHSRRAGGVAVTGHRQPATARARVLRSAAPSQHRGGPVSVPALRAAHRPGQVAAAAPAEAGRAQ